MSCCSPFTWDFCCLFRVNDSLHGRNAFKQTFISHRYVNIVRKCGKISSTSAYICKNWLKLVSVSLAVYMRLSSLSFFWCLSKLSFLYFGMWFRCVVAIKLFFFRFFSLLVIVFLFCFCSSCFQFIYITYSVYLLVENLNTLDTHTVHIAKHGGN